ncbi:MAG TPA: TOBE domain-containing protein [Rhabdaerophilum sp.]|nr:TOBE domain-containing protein [Rhabdaerophilum sp.]
MRDGRLVQIGASREIYNKPVDIEAARFFCDLNEIEARARSGRVETPVGIFSAPGKADGEKAIVAIRPQSIRLKAAGFCLPGRILARRFVGEVELVDLAVQGLDRPVRARVQDLGTVRPGNDVGVDIRADDVLVF